MEDCERHHPKGGATTKQRRISQYHSKGMGRGVCRDD